MKQTKTQKENPVHPRAKKKTSLDLKNARIVFFEDGHCLSGLYILDNIIALKKAGYDIVYYGPKAHKSPILKESEIPQYTNAKDAFANCQIVITLCKPEKLKDYYLEKNGILDTLDTGAYCLDFSFCNAQTSREIQTLAALKDIHYVDAPFDGLGSEESTIMFVGGEEKPRNDLMPLLPYFANTIECYEKPGDGQIAIYIAYHALFSGILEASTLILCYKKMGLSKKSILKVLNDTGCTSRIYREYVPKMLEHDYYSKINLHHWYYILTNMLQIMDLYDFEEPVIETVHWLCVYIIRIGGENLGLQSLAIFNEDEGIIEELGLDCEICNCYFDENDEEFYEDCEGLSNAESVDYYSSKTYNDTENFNDLTITEKFEAAQDEIMKLLNSRNKENSSETNRLTEVPPKIGIFAKFFSKN